MAAISKEKVSCTEVCIAAAGGCGFATGAAGAGALFTGAIGVWVVSGMVAGVVVCGNTGSLEVTVAKSDIGSIVASAAGDSLALDMISSGCSWPIDSTGISVEASTAGHAGSLSQKVSLNSSGINAASFGSAGDSYDSGKENSISSAGSGI
jgi:hypothetical protein